MRKLFFIAFALQYTLPFLAAHNSKVATQPVKKAQSQPAPVKLGVPATDVKKRETSPHAPHNAPRKAASVNTHANKPAEKKAENHGKPPVKKDGTPEKRYIENLKLRKDSTPHKRSKHNTATGAQ